MLVQPWPHAGRRRQRPSARSIMNPVHRANLRELHRPKRRLRRTGLRKTRLGTRKTMKIERLTPIYADGRPFASVYIEVSRDQEQGNRIVELGVRAVVEDLAEQGAPA